MLPNLLLLLPLLLCMSSFKAITLCFSGACSRCMSCMLWMLRLFSMGSCWLYMIVNDRGQWLHLRLLLSCVDIRFWWGGSRCWYFGVTCRIRLVLDEFIVVLNMFFRLNSSCSWIVLLSLSCVRVILLFLLTDRMAIETLTDSIGGTN